jgi:hypothetical protein
VTVTRAFMAVIYELRTGAVSPRLAPFCTRLNSSSRPINNPGLVIAEA